VQRWVPRSLGRVDDDRFFMAGGAIGRRESL
jgi:hypothetical protein